jgi:hypothetical protein
MSSLCHGISFPFPFLLPLDDPLPLHPCTD